jgi:hypothetical protein
MSSARGALLRLGARMRLTDVSLRGARSRGFGASRDENARLGPIARVSTVSSTFRRAISRFRSTRD